MLRPVFAAGYDQGLVHGGEDFHAIGNHWMWNM